jgi:hypothetical protein
MSVFRKTDCPNEIVAPGSKKFIGRPDREGRKGANIAVLPMPTFA